MHQAPHAFFDLSAERWQRLRELLDEALALEPARRAPWLAALSGADAELKPRLQALLEHAAAGTGWLDALPQVETGDFARAPGRVAGTAAIGPYGLS